MKKYAGATMGCVVVLCAFFSPLIGFTQTVAMPESNWHPKSEKVVGEISKLEVKLNSDGRWVAICDIAISGKPRWLGIQLEAVAGVQPPSVEGLAPTLPFAIPAKSGEQQIVIELERPNLYTQEVDFQNLKIIRDYKNVKTTWVVARLFESEGPETLGPLLSSQITKALIAWPDKSIWTADKEIRDNGAKHTLDRAIAMIDTGADDSLQRAKFLLERLLVRDSKLVGAYVELARVAMKSNWGQEGLFQAESYISSALQIDSQNSNALILRGYVYTHQGRLKLADADFNEAQKAHPKNLWLWANWGELRAIQGKQDEAIAMYHKAIGSPVTNDTYDQARLDAYSKLIGLYERRRDVAAMDAMYLQRTQDYGSETCFGSAYAQFKLQLRGDPDGAIQLTKDLTQLQCANVSPREILGMAYYLSWARSTDAGGSEILNRARVFFPSSARLFLRLCESVQTVEAAKRLVNFGDSIDQLDNRRMTALAYALTQRNLETVRRLIQLGARPTALIGDGDFPVALLPVVSNDIEGVKFLRQLGVNYGKLTYRGESAMDFARRSGNQKLIAALKERSAKL